MNRIGTFGWGFTYEGVFDAGAVSAESLIRLLSPEMAAAVNAFFTDEIVLFEERDCKFLLGDFHSFTHAQPVPSEPSGCYMLFVAAEISTFCKCTGKSGALPAASLISQKVLCKSFKIHGYLCPELSARNHWCFIRY